MSVKIDSVKNFVPLNSIVNPKTRRADASDRTTPLTYVDWLKHTRFDTKETLDFTKYYNSYLKEWSRLQSLTAAESKTLISDRYKDLLRDITLNYTTAEERRFLANIDFSSARHVESALPFYVSKIKQITLYVSRQRDLIKQQKIMSSHAGSVYGLTRELTTNVLNRILDPTKFNVSDTTTGKEPYFNIRIVELYDYSKSYFNQKNIPIAPIIFDGATEIIRQVLQDCHPVLILANDINLILEDQPVIINDDAEVTNLDYSEFYNYRKQIDNLNRVKQVEYVSDRLGAEINELKAGRISLLNSPEKPWRNLLNRHGVSVNDRHATTDQKSIDEIGGFFLPRNTGVLTFFSFKPELNITNNSVSVSLIQDAKKHGNSVWSSTIGNPIDHHEDVTWVKADIANGGLYGDIVNSRTHAKFSGYTSIDEVSLYPHHGVSRTTDRFGFFSGNRNAEWANEDVFPVKDQFVFDIDARQEKLLVGHQTLCQWRTDIFGNEFALYKQIQPERGPFDVGLDDIIDFEKAPNCEVLDGGDSLRKQKEDEEEEIEIEIFEGGRIGGFDPKIEQYMVPTPFPDIRRMLDTDADGEPVFEDWNANYYGLSPVTRRPEVGITPIAFHGFAPDVMYDRQAYCGLFTDDICGRLYPEIKRCAIVDNYTYNVYTEESPSGDYQSADQSIGTDDAFDEYINPGSSFRDDDLGFSNYGIPLSADIEVIDGANIDGMFFSTEICETLVGDFEYTEETETYFDQSLDVGKTKYSDTPEKSMRSPKTLYEQSTNVGGNGFFRSYNGSKIESIDTALVNILAGFDYLEGDDYDIFLQEIREGRLIDMDVIYDTLVLETTDHLLIEKINFDDKNSTILPTGSSNIFLKTTGVNPKLERSISRFFNETRNELFIGTMKSKESPSGETYVYPVMYIVDLNTLKYKQAHPNKHYKDQLDTLFVLPDDLLGYSIESIDRPVMSFNDDTNVYNISYSAMLLNSEGMSKYAIFSCDYRQGQYNIKLVDSYVYHSDSLAKHIPHGEEWDDRIDSRLVKLFPDDQMRPIPSLPHTTRTDSISAMVGHSLSGYKFDLEIDTKTIPVSYNLDDFKINRIEFDPGDGSDLYVNDRIMDDGLQVLTFDLTDMPDPSDFGDPRRLGFKHEYLFDKSDPHVYTASVTATYSNFMTAVYNINIETEPYSVQSGFDGAKLIDTKLYTDVEGKDRQLLVIETQNPRYVTNVVIDRNNGQITEMSGYVDGSRYSGKFHIGSDGRYMTGTAPRSNSREITPIPSTSIAPGLQNLNTSYSY
jgi:hypothetical protein